MLLPTVLPIVWRAQSWLSKCGTEFEHFLCNQRLVFPSPCIYVCEIANVLNNFSFCSWSVFGLYNGCGNQKMYLFSGSLVDSRWVRTLGVEESVSSEFG